MFQVINGIRTVGSTLHGKAHPDYVTVDPDYLAERLANGGLQVEVKRSLMRKSDHGKESALACVIASDRLWETGEPGGSEYRRAVSILCDHRGKARIKVRAGAIRCSCENQFHGLMLWSATHTSIEALKFIDNPWEVVNQCLIAGEQLPHRIESLRGVPGGDMLLNAVSVALPRLGGRALENAMRYRERDTVTMWSALQGLTHGNNGRLGELAGKVITEGWNEAKEGQVPACLERVLFS